VEVYPDGTFTTIIEELNLPTPVDFIGNTACVVSLASEFWKLEDVSNPPFSAAEQLHQQGGLAF
jgi:hypothetical protein